MLLKLDLCGLGVSGVQMFEDAAVNIGVADVGNGFALREGSTIVRFLGGILILFAEFRLA